MSLIIRLLALILTASLAWEYSVCLITTDDIAMETDWDGEEEEEKKEEEKIVRCFLSDHDHWIDSNADTIMSHCFLGENWVSPLLDQLTPPPKRA